MKQKTILLPTILPTFIAFFLPKIYNLPMTLTIVFVCLSFCCALAMLIAQSKDKRLARFMLKAIASILFVLAAFSAVSYADQIEKAALLLVFGLVFGMLGDIFLSCDYISTPSDARKLELFGVFTFLANQILNLVYFCLSCTSFNYLLIIFVASMVIMIFTFNQLKILQLGNFLIPMLLYVLIASTVIAFAANNYILYHTDKSIIQLAAATLFGFSDLCLGFANYTEKKLFIYKILCIIPYYIAQGLFAISILL